MVVDRELMRRTLPYPLDKHMWAQTSKQGNKKKREKEINRASMHQNLNRNSKLTGHLSTLMNSTCFPPNDVTAVCFNTPTSSRTSDNLAPPQIAEQVIKI